MVGEAGGAVAVDPFEVSRFSTSAIAKRAAQTVLVETGHLSSGRWGGNREPVDDELPGKRRSGCGRLIGKPLGRVRNRVRNVGRGHDRR